MKNLLRVVSFLAIVLMSATVSGQGWTVNPADYTFNGSVTAVVTHGSAEVTTGTLGAFVGGTCRGYVNGTFFPPTGKTVFIMMVYSNVESGETLTFKYFDPSDGSYYDISQTESFVSEMILGDANSPLQYYTLPLVYSVTGGGSYCEGGPGLPVGLSGSESGVTYTLLKNGTAQVPTVTGTGSAITFGDQLGATYTISGTNSGGTVMMTGNAVIVENPLPLVPVSNAGSGATCTQITANWTASANSTSYLLDASTASDFSTYLPGYQDLDVGNVTSKSIPGLVAGTPYYYRIRGNNSCGTSGNSTTIAYSTSPATPATPGTITGTDAQCPALAGQTYSIAAVTNATTYTWTVPTGWTITSGQGTISIAVTTGATGNNGNITVTAGNSCGTSAANSLAVTVLAGTPATPAAITGTAAQCPALAGQTYSISAVTNATSYTWTVPTGWTITSGQGTISIAVTTGATGNNGSITVTAGNSCGTSAANSLAVSVLAGTPATPGTITGTAAQCPALAGQTYSISAVTNATTYTWTVPTGWTITSGQGTISIAVTTGATGNNGSITVTAGNSCGTSAANSLAVTVLAGTPATPAAITGTAAQCPALTGQTYSIAAVTNATTYTWTVPTGWTITSGQGTISIAVTTGATGNNGSITVTAGNSCGTSAANSLTVSVLAGTPATPAAITGTAAQCPALAGQTYSIASVTNATSYTWTVPTGWTITSGQGTISIAVTTGATGNNGSITVTAGNSCGTSAANSLAVTVLAGTPATPAAITGTAAQCPALAGQSYSIASVTNATTYTWTVPTGWTITSGQGTISIAVTTGATGNNGNITVTAGNSCGTSTANSLAVTVLAGTPATPAAITGTAAQCPALAGQTYSIAAVTNATTYTWTVPTGWTITSGQGTTSVSVTTGATGNNGSITVTAGNSCGTSAASSLSVGVNAIPIITGTFNVCMGSTTQLTGYGTPAVSSPWISASTNVALVSNTGLVTPVNPGTSLIRYTDIYGCSNSVTVTVNSLPVITGTLSIYLGYTTQLTGSGIPAVSSPWISSNLAVATVSSTGLVTSVSGGTSLITYTDINGCSNSATVTINLVNYNKSLNTGWNWFSVNASVSNMSLSTILPTVTTDGDYIKDQVSSATYYTGYGWFGSLTTIDPSKLYKLKVQNSSIVTYSGAPVNVNLKPISLVSGWNWIGYLPQSAQTLSDCFSSYPLTDLDYVKNQSQSSTYYIGYGWFGSLTDLSPTDGYMVKVANAGTLNYPDIPFKNGIMDQDELNVFTINPNEYEFNGSVTAEVLIDGIKAGSENTFLLAYVDNKLRGVASGHYFDPRGTYVFPMMIFSNTSEGEKIEFRYYDAVDDKFYPCKETIRFVKDMIVADANKSLTLNTGKNISENNGNRELKTFPNPFEHILNIEYTLSKETNILLSVHDASGKMVEQIVNEVQKPGTYSYKWHSDSQSAGMYIIKLQTDNEVTIQKAILIR